ncbi:hypothetical protein Hanom_Chr10g00965861 [Helianthus anomalus]
MSTFTSISYLICIQDNCSYMFSGIKQEKIIIQNKWGEKLVGVLHETGSKEIVTVSDGVQSTKEYSMLVDFCIALEKLGISAFRFDFSGNGYMTTFPSVFTIYFQSGKPYK